MDYTRHVAQEAEEAEKPQLSLLTQQERGLTSVESDLPLSFLTLPDEVLNEIHMINENIQALAKKQNLRVIGIASTHPNEGSSLTAAALAIVSAKSYEISPHSRPRETSPRNAIELSADRRKRAVMLLDAQLRHPTIHRFFGLPASSGLLDYLCAEIPTNSVDFRPGAKSDAEIKYIPNLNLNVITAGTERRARISQIDSGKLTSLFGFLNRQFAQTFVDLPPILACAEGRALAKMCDGVVLVVRAGKTRHQAVEAARRLLENARVNVLGGVVNRRRFFIPETLYRWL